MWKLILLLSLLPTVAAVLLRKFYCDRVLRDADRKSTNQSGKLLVEHLLRHQKSGGEIEVVQKGRSRLGSQSPPRVHLSLEAWEGKDVANLAEVSSLLGRAMVAQELPKPSQWREWAVRFGWAFPAFTLLVVIFSVIVAKVSVMVGITVVCAALGLGSLMLLLTMPVEWEAAKRVAHLIESSRALPRRADGEEVAKCCRALAWKRVVPGVLEWFLKKPSNPREDPPAR